jgi:hypothetical protein
MITRAVFKILEVDETDILAATAITKLQAKYPSFTSSGLEDYHYQSLRTLCKETSGNVDPNGNKIWAEKHIKYFQKKDKAEENNLQKTDLPIIIIDCPDCKLASNSGWHEGRVTIDVYTDAMADTSQLVASIVNRIKSIFICNPAYTCSTVRKFENPVKGMESITINPVEIQDNSSWNHRKLICEFNMQIYEVVQ